MGDVVMMYCILFYRQVDFATEHPFGAGPSALLSIWLGVLVVWPLWDRPASFFRAKDQSVDVDMSAGIDWPSRQACRHVPSRLAYDVPFVGTRRIRTSRRFAGWRRWWPF